MTDQDEIRQIKQRLLALESAVAILNRRGMRFRGKSVLDRVAPAPKRTPPPLRTPVAPMCGALLPPTSSTRPVPSDSPGFSRPPTQVYGACDDL